MIILQMKKVCFLIIISVQCFGQSYDSLIQNAFRFYSQKDYASSLKMYEQAFEQNSNHPNTKYYLYNAAINASLLEDETKAFKYLNQAIEKVWDDPVQIIQNEAFNYLKQFDSWKEKFGNIEGNVDSGLQAQLLVIKKNDQAILNAVESAASIQQRDSLVIIRDSVMKAHTSWMDRHLDKEGFVSKFIVGKGASEVQFLVLQHSEVSFQKKHYSLFLEATKDGLLEKRQLALLEDRIAIAEKRRQLYGTQLFYDKEKSAYFFSPIESVENVNNRRSAVGLPLMEEYAAHYNIVWSIEYYLANEATSLKKFSKK